MNIELVYCYPMAGGQFDTLAEQFVSSYLQNDPMMEHSTTVVCNGHHQSPNCDVRGLFACLPDVKFIEHDNSGYDIGAFQRASNESLADFIIFFGASAYVKGKGWLYRYAEAYSKYGEAQYGAMGHRGAMPGVYPHIRTTGLGCSPKLFNQYPIKITDRSARYPFEHGPECFTNWISRMGLKSWVVVHTGEFLWENWDLIPNGYHRGDQSNLLSGDRVSRPPYYHTA